MHLFTHPSRRFCTLLLAVVFGILSFASFSPALTAQASEITETDNIKLNVKNKTLTVDSTFSLKVYNTSTGQKLSYKSSDGDVVSVSSKGLLEAKKVGEASITVFVKQGSKIVETLTCDVVVGPAAISVVFTKDKVSLEVGDRTTLKTVLKPKNTTEDPVFSSSNSDVATVSSTGTVTAKSAGTTIIYAKINNEKFDRCVITVKEGEKEN